MPSFEYKAYNQQARLIKGYVEADSVKSARQQLRDNGIIPLDIKTSSGKDSKGSILELDVMDLFFKRSMPIQDLILLTRQLGTLVAAGIPLERSLNMIGLQADNAAMRKTVSGIRTSVAEGMSFSNSLRNANRKFPSEYIASIEAGEESGNMDKVLERLADDIEEVNKTRQALTAALVYPAVMVFVAIAIIVLLMVYVVPQVTEVFASQNQELPGLTKTLISTSAFLRSYGWTLLLLILAIIGGFNYSMRNPRNRFKFDKFLIGLPVIGRWIMMAIISRWARSLGLLIAGGVPTIKAMQIAVGNISNTYVSSLLNEVNKNVSEGMNINKSLKRAKIFPSFLVYMVDSGEQSGNLDQMLVKCADYYSQLLRTATQSMLRIFEPLLILSMGMIVLVIILAILMPIFQINQLVL